MASRSRGRGRGRGESERGSLGSRGRGPAPGRGRPLEIYTPSNGAAPAPDAKVTSNENAVVQDYVKSKGSALPDMARMTLDQRIPKRPAYGKHGIEVTLTANYFELVPNAGTNVFRYNLDISPEVTGKKRMRVVQLLISETPVSALNPGLATDFKSTLLTTKELPASHLQQEVKHRVEGEDEVGDDAPQYRVKLQLTGRFSVSDLIEYLTSTSVNAAFEQDSELTQNLNIIMGFYSKAQPAHKVMSIGSNKHFALSGPSSGKFDLKAGLQAWRGYLISARIASARVLLNVQVKTAATYKNGRLYDLIQEFALENGRSPLKIERFVRRLTVQPIHLIRKNKSGGDILRFKTIHGLATPFDGKNLDHPPRVPSHGANAKQVEFYVVQTPPKLKKKGASLKTPRYISVYDYFDIVYDIRVKTDVSVVNVGDRQNPSYLPTDVCQVAPAQQARAKLSPNQTAQMIRFAVRRPNENAKSVAVDSRAALGFGEANPTLTAFGLNVGKELITVHGRILKGPAVRYRQGRSTETLFGGWKMGPNKFTRGAALSKWSILWIQSLSHEDPWNRDPQRLIEELLKPFHTSLRDCGINASPPILPGISVTCDDDDPGPAIQRGFQQLVDRKSNEELILVILPTSGKDETMYSHVKYCGDVVHGIKTVCALAGNLKARNPQLYANIALKFNLKLGGTNQTLDPAKLGFIGEGKTMVVGIDVTHPSPGSSESAPSVAGMVASTDSSLGQFPAILKVQEPRKEMVSELGDMLKTRLQLWRKYNNKQLPEIIVVCRDGVSEGQYNIVVEEELPLLKAACREIYPSGGEPSLSIIVVGKRHNTRFYPTSADKFKVDERSANTPSGTVVDRGVTQARNWDFYLQSHSAIQGTARPAHYFVVHDEIFAQRRIPQGFNSAADVLEDIIHNMCYTFGRATKAVSVCTPAYYADLVCERARLYLRHLYSPEATPAASQTGGQEGSRDGKSAQDMVRLHDNIKDTMFYI